MLTVYAKFIREKYTVIIITTLVLGILISLFTPAPGLAIRKICTFLMLLMFMAINTTVSFYQIFLRSLPARSPQPLGPSQGVNKPEVR